MSQIATQNNRHFFCNIKYPLSLFCPINGMLCLVAVIFVIDSNNIERITEAHEELAKLMAEKRLKDALLLIYANKQVQIVQLFLNCYQGCCQYGIPIGQLSLLPTKLSNLF